MQTDALAATGKDRFLTYADRIIRLLLVLQVLLAMPSTDRAAESQQPGPPSTGTSNTAMQGAEFLEDLAKGRFWFVPNSPNPPNSPGSRIELPRRPHVSHSHRPLRQVLLIGGDRFVGECLDWGTSFAHFQRTTGQKILIPISAISAISNPPGEIDVVAESFELDSSGLTAELREKMLDQTQATTGKSSLRIDSACPGYRQTLESPLESARIEFSFQVFNNDPGSRCGEWQIEWGDAEPMNSPLVVRIHADRSVSVSDLGQLTAINATQPTLPLSAGWHSLIALIEPERTRIIVDETLLSTRQTPKSGLKGIRFLPPPPDSPNRIWIDGLQIRKLLIPTEDERTPVTFRDQDVLVTETGDELFGRMRGFTETAVTLEAIGKMRSIPLKRLTAMHRSQTAKPVSQQGIPKSGVVARIEMQPFVDRPALQPDIWTVTILVVDAKQLTVQHPLIGEMKFPWSEVSRIDPLFFGQTVLADARRFHLGDSIRADFDQQLPNGTTLAGTCDLVTIPTGQPWFSLDVAEIEAAGPDAPPGSPFLAELRAGNLLTEVFINEQRIGNLNEQLRFRPSLQNPDRIRLAIPRTLLRQGKNTFELRQLPLKKEGREFDEGEIGNIRFDFEQDKKWLNDKPSARE